MGLERLGELLTTLLVASLTWASGLLTPGVEPERSAPVAAAPAGEHAVMMGWAQSEQTQIEQVGEGNSDDTETLDQGTTPADVQPTGDTEGLDQTTAAANDEDVELLDQGAPPTTATTYAPAPSSAAPVYSDESTSAAPAASYGTQAPASAPATGPSLPPGFGSGRVHVSTGQGGFPEGLANCHVGAVTGRAYVGIDCGEDGAGDSFVGHAPSFQDFPFVVEEDFPFDDRSGVFSSRDSDATDTSGNVVVSSGGRNKKAAKDEGTVQDGSVIGIGSTEMTQTAKDRKPRVSVSGQGNSRERSRQKNDKTANNASSANNGSGAAYRQASDNDAPAKAESKKQKAHTKHGKKHDRKQKDHKGKGGKGRGGAKD